MPSVSRCAFKDQEGIALENEAIRAVLLPDWGAKTVSLVHKGLGIETLWQNPGPCFARTNYGDSFGEGEFAGFDEMFPTISRCFCDVVPWAGTELPDHGEVWTIPWETRIEGDSVSFGVNGTRFPYRLEKTVTLEGSSLLAHYVAMNLGAFPLDYIWAAHPLFNATEGMRFIVPEGMRKAINAIPGPTLGGYGVGLDFPVARLSDGETVRLDRVPARNDIGYQKYWFAEKVKEGWCMIRDDRSTLTIGLAFPKESVPYLGMWLNEGGYNGQYNIAPEPATAPMDRPDIAKMWGKGSVLAPGAKVEWQLVIALAAGRTPIGMTEGGVFAF